MTDGGALMLDRHLQPVWFNPGSDEDLMEETFEGNPVLTWWESAADGSRPTLSVVDQHYRLVARLTALRGWDLDMHEAVISGHDVWVLADRVLSHVKLTSGPAAPRGNVLDEAVQEYDLRTGKLLRSWDAFNPGRAPHVPASASEMAAPRDPGTPWDAYHANSIQLVGSHEFLVSMRNTFAAYLVDIRTGRILWTLGGKQSSFTVPPAERFSFQHDVRLHPGGIVTAFNNRCCAQEGAGRWGPAYGSSSGLVMKLNFKTRAVSVLREYMHQPLLDSRVEGSLLELPNANVLLSWGSEPYFSEYSARGKLLLDAKLAIGQGSYRVLLTSGWVGMPSYPPSAALRTASGVRTLYASWNGATEVAAWRVLVGLSPTTLRPVARVPRTGFETAVRLPDQPFTNVRLEALNAKGKAIGSRDLTAS